ncbi:MAG TPA: hypothetical protein VK766_03470 [Cytophagaceae bacterium]|jgi:hypothetical protein|nr:hypothetical protein [Cytophagaceae bacterium]
MNFAKNIGIITILLLVNLFVTSCYKKDLEEFKSVDSVKYTPQVALPFIYSSLTLKDSIPSIPGIPVITMTDTASITLPNSNTKDTLQSIITDINFRLHLENSFPFSGIIQIYFADSNNVFIDSVLTNADRTIPLGNPLLVKDIDVNITQQRYFTLTSKSKKMYVYYKLSTSTISGLSNDSLKVHIGINAALSLNLKK